MAKTLRVRTRAGWVTKPVANAPENLLSAEEIDDNFLAIEDQIIAASGIDVSEIGDAALLPQNKSMSGWLPMDGTRYSAVTYASLGTVMEANKLFDYVLNADSPVAALESEPEGSYYTVCRGLALTSDGSTVMAVYNDRPVDSDTLYRLAAIDTTSWNYTQPLGPTLRGQVYAVDTSADGLYACIGYNTSSTTSYDVHLLSDWSLVGGTAEILNSCRSVGFSLDSSQLAIGTFSTPYLYVLETTSWTVISGPPTLAGSAWAVKYSPDSTKLAVGFSATPGLRVLDTSTWADISVPSIAGTVYGIAFSFDGNYLAVASSGSPYLTVLNTSTWTAVTGLPSIADQCRSVAFSPDGDYLAVATFQPPYMLLINTADWSIVPTHDTIPYRGVSVVFSADSNSLVVGTVGLPVVTVLERGTTDSFRIIARDAPNADFVWKIKAE